MQAFLGGAMSQQGGVSHVKRSTFDGNIGLFGAFALIEGETYIDCPPGTEAQEANFIFREGLRSWLSLIVQVTIVSTLSQAWA
jgi:hypothetical protein